MRKWLILVLTMTVTAAVSLAQAPEQPSAEPIRIAVDYSKGHFVYRIESKLVSLADSLRTLGDTLRTRGNQIPVIVLADEWLSFERIENLKGIIDKAGAQNVHYYVVGSDKRLMQPFHSEQAIPYSLNPPLDDHDQRSY